MKPPLAIALLLLCIQCTPAFSSVLYDFEGVNSFNGDPFSFDLSLPTYDTGQYEGLLVTLTSGPATLSPCTYDSFQSGTSLTFSCDNNFGGDGTEPGSFIAIIGSYAYPTSDGTYAITEGGVFDQEGDPLGIYEFTDLTITNSVPEPSTAALTWSAILLVLCFGYRRWAKLTFRIAPCLNREPSTRKQSSACPGYVGRSHSRIDLRRRG